MGDGALIENRTHTDDLQTLPKACVSDLPMIESLNGRWWWRHSFIRRAALIEADIVPLIILRRQFKEDRRG
jgi:hypothetical protein